MWWILFEKERRYIKIEPQQLLGRTLSDIFQNIQKFLDLFPEKKSVQESTWSF